MLIGIALVLGANVIAAFSQLFLKISAKKSYGSWWREYLNLLVITAYILFFCTTILNVCALHYIPLTLSAALETSGQIMVPIVSYLFLREKIGKRKRVGMAGIALGILVFVL